MNAYSPRLTAAPTVSYGALDERERGHHRSDDEHLVTRSCALPPLQIFSLLLLMALFSAFIVHHFFFRRDHPSSLSTWASEDVGALKLALEELERRVLMLERRMGEAHFGAGEGGRW